MKPLKINRLQFSIGVLFLLAGTLEYLFSRPPGSAYFLNPIHSFVNTLHDKITPFGKLSFQAPDFFHPLAFALMCMALLPDSIKSRITICLAWFGIDAAMELSQKYGAELTRYLPQWTAKIPVVENLPIYLFHGTYDNYDLLAIAAGSLTAFFFGHFTRGGRTHEQTA